MNYHLRNTASILNQDDDEFADENYNADEYLTEEKEDEEGDELDKVEEEEVGGEE